MGEFKAKFRFGEFRIEFILRGLEAFYAVYGLYLDYFFLIGLSKLDLLEPILTLFWEAELFFLNENEFFDIWL